MFVVLQDEINDVIAELRVEISKLRDKIAAAAEPNRDDVDKMEVLAEFIYLLFFNYVYFLFFIFLLFLIFTMRQNTCCFI